MLNMLSVVVYFSAGVTFGYPKQPKLFNDLDFGIDMKSRSKSIFLKTFIYLLFSCVATRTLVPKETRDSEYLGRFHCSLGPISVSATNQM